MSIKQVGVAIALFSLLIFVVLFGQTPACRCVLPHFIQHDDQYPDRVPLQWEGILFAESGILTVSRKGPVGILSRFIRFKIPDLLIRTDAICTGGRLSKYLEILFDYLINQNHPVILVCWPIARTPGSFLKLADALPGPPCWLGNPVHLQELVEPPNNSQGIRSMLQPGPDFLHVQSGAFKLIHNHSQEPSPEDALLSL